jgi:hypothetical protein
MGIGGGEKHPGLLLSAMEASETDAVPGAAVPLARPLEVLLPLAILGDYRRHRVAGRRATPVRKVLHPVVSRRV